MSTKSSKKLPRYMKWCVKHFWFTFCFACVFLLFLPVYMSPKVSAKNSNNLLSGTRSAILDGKLRRLVCNRAWQISYRVNYDNDDMFM